MKNCHSRRFNRESGVKTISPIEAFGDDAKCYVDIRVLISPRTLFMAALTQVQATPLRETPLLLAFDSGFYG
jgi:hypothetical protein